MGALDGQIITTVTKADGTPAVTVTWFFDPTTRILRNNPTSWTAPDGTVYPAGTGALIADNQLGRQVRVTVMGPDPDDPTPATPSLPLVSLREVKVGTGGKSFTKFQLANAPAPDGPYITAADFNGLTFDLS